MTTAYLVSYFVPEQINRTTGALMCRGYWRPTATFGSIIAAKKWAFDDDIITEHSLEDATRFHNAHCLPTKAIKGAMAR